MMGNLPRYTFSSVEVVFWMFSDTMDFVVNSRILAISAGVLSRTILAAVVARCLRTVCLTGFGAPPFAFAFASTSFATASASATAFASALLKVNRSPPSTSLPSSLSEKSPPMYSSEEAASPPNTISGDSPVFNILMYSISIS